jgi:hypothetical protein
MTAMQLVMMDALQHVKFKLAIKIAVVMVGINLLLMVHAKQFAEMVLNEDISNVMMEI